MFKLNDKKIKTEIQTQSGLLNSIKEKKLPNTREMAKKTLMTFFDNFHIDRKNQRELAIYIKENTSNLLKDLIVLETKIYKEIENSIYREFLSYYINNLHKRPENDYKELEGLMIFLEEKYKNISFEDIGEIVSELYPVFRHVVFSAYQSRKTRVGKTLEHYINFILDATNIPFQEQVDITDSIVDFALPSEKVFDSHKEDGVFIAAQTTLKDRFRLSLGKLPSEFSKTKKYIMTAAGINIITDTDHRDVTKSKIYSIDNQNFELVVFKELKEEKFTDEDIVISYETFINDRIQEHKKIWERKKLI